MTAGLIPASMRRTLCAGLALGLSALAAPLSAATVDITVLSFGDLASARAAKAAAEAGHAGTTEDFEGFQDRDHTDGSSGLQTSVGTFYSLGGGTGSACGGSCVDPEGEAVIRTGTTFGRYNTTEQGNTWLDSNDTRGMAALVPGSVAGGAIDLIAFLLTDVDDVGAAAFRVVAGGRDAEVNLALDRFENDTRQPNGALNLVLISFSEAVNIAGFGLIIDQTDGFGIDDVFVGAQIPLPAGGLMLLGALGGLGLMRRRRKAA